MRWGCHMAYLKQKKPAHPVPVENCSGNLGTQNMKQDLSQGKDVKSSPPLLVHGPANAGSAIPAGQNGR